MRSIPASARMPGYDRVVRVRHPLTLSLSPGGGEGIEAPPSPSARERAGVRVAQVFTHNPG